jgi:glucosylceramidase
VESWGLISKWIKDGVNAYLAWNMVLDSVGLSLDQVRPWAQNALITVNGSNYTLTPYYYVFRHLANFVDPGAYRVDTSGSFSDVLAFENPDGSVVAVLYNSGGSARQTTLTAKGTTVSFSARPTAGRR